MDQTLVEHARSLLEGNAYLTLGTVGADGRPWTTPVYFAADGLTDFYRMSSTGSLHSKHLADNPAVSVVVFDSTVAPYHGRALYAAASAQQVEGTDRRRGLEVDPGPATRGGSPVTEEDVTDPVALAALPRPGDGRVGPVPARAPATLPVARSRRRPPGPSPPGPEG